MVSFHAVSETSYTELLATLDYAWDYEKLFSLKSLAPLGGFDTYVLAESGFQILRSTSAGGLLWLQVRT